MDEVAGEFGKLVASKVLVRSIVFLYFLLHEERRGFGAIKKLRYNVNDSLSVIVIQFCMKNLRSFSVLL